MSHASKRHWQRPKTGGAATIGGGGAWYWVAQRQSADVTFWASQVTPHARPRRTANTTAMRGAAQVTSGYDHCIAADLLRRSEKV